jgi:hypothetical protein
MRAATGNQFQRKDAYAKVLKVEKDPRRLVIERELAARRSPRWAPHSRSALTYIRRL